MKNKFNLKLWLEKCATNKLYKKHIVYKYKWWKKRTNERERTKNMYETGCENVRQKLQRCGGSEKKLIAALDDNR